MNTFHLRIVTMDGKVFDDQASQIFLRTIDGDVAIRAGHINYCSGIGMGCGAASGFISKTVE